MIPFQGKGLRTEHFNQEVTYIIDDFLVEQAITMMYAPPKQGKSRLAIGIASYLFENTDHNVMYLDFDNPLSALVERGINKVIERGGKNFDYIHPEVAGMESHEVLSRLVAHADHGNYKGWVFFFDSLTDFANENDDSAAKRFMHKVKTLRNAGATVILLHHSNKSEKGYKGSSILRSAIDNMYLVNKISTTKGHDTFVLEAEAPRFDVKRVAFELNNHEYRVKKVDYELAIITPDDRGMIDTVLEHLRKAEEGLGQSELLKELDKPKNDRVLLSLFKKYEGRFWKIEPGANKKKIYKAL